MVRRGDKAYMVAEKAYYGLVFLTLGIMGVFTYMSWFFYHAMAGTFAQWFTIVIAMPILISLLLLALLLLAGKEATANELLRFIRNE